MSEQGYMARCLELEAKIEKLETQLTEYRSGLFDAEARLKRADDILRRLWQDRVEPHDLDDVEEYFKGAG